MAISDHICEYLVKYPHNKSIDAVAHIIIEIILS